MLIYPAIDLKEGRCVRLAQGQFEQVTHYADPLTIAKQYAMTGIQYLHVVDLDGAASGVLQQLPLITEISRNTGLALQVGGGIRNLEILQALFANGIARAVIGSLALTAPLLVKQWLALFGPEKIVLALDVRRQDDDYLVATHGWQTTSNSSLWSVVADYLTSGIRHILCTDIARDGLLQGPNFELYQQCQQKYSQIAWQASGGVRSIADLQQLKTIGLSGVIVGKALLEGKIELGSADISTILARNC